MKILIYNNFIYRIFNALCTLISKSSHLRLTFNKLLKYWKEIQAVRLINNDFIIYSLKKKEALLLHKEKIRTIAYRGSNADYGFIPSLQNGTYNLGLTSSDLYVSYSMYISILRKLPNLQNIILFYSVSCCGLELIKTIEKYREVIYSLVFDFPLETTNCLVPKYVQYLNTQIKTINSVEFDEQFAGYDLKSFMQPNAHERLRTHIRENRREPDQLKWLVRLAESVNQDTRRLFIVLPPFRSDYLQLLPDKEQLYKKLYNLDLPKSTYIIDFHGSSIFDDTDFGDTDHMNYKGAQKLTNEILHYIENL